MYKVLDIIKLSDDYLKKKGIENSRLNSELLLSHLLNCKRLDIYIMYDKPLSEDEIEKMRAYIIRRGNNEPLQYIIGETEFYGRKFFLDNNVLIPRQETETLIEFIINKYSVNQPKRILDIGIGSGIIAITLGLELKNSKVIGVDVSNEAISIAKKNIDFHNCSDNVYAKQFDIFNDDITNLGDFDLIVSNPPYISLNDFENLSKEVLHYEPRIALTDEKNGFSFYKKILDLFYPRIKSNSAFIFELEYKGFSEVESLLNEKNLDSIEYKEDLLGHKRVIYGIKK